MPVSHPDPAGNIGTLTTPGAALPADPHGRIRILSISRCFPYQDIDHGGGRYVAQLARAWEPFADVTWAVPDNVENQQALARPGRPEDVVLVGRSGSRSAASRALSFAAHQAQARVTLGGPTRPPLTMASRLLLAPALRAAVRDADVIDLQWLEYIRLHRLIRRLNPRARVVGTFHDSTAQAFTRYAESLPMPERARWQKHASDTARSEAVAAGAVDIGVVFSEKDRELVDPGGRHNVVVLPPAQQISGPVDRDPSAGPTCVFVGHFGRPENESGLRWLLEAVWPLVRSERTDAHLLLVGPGASAELSALVSSTPGVRFTGFVPDLGEVLGRAWVALSPLLRGGGVKFKTVESLLAGTPTVATTVGAEGIVPMESLTAVEDDAEGFSRAVLHVLSDPLRAARETAAHQDALQDSYGWPAFDRRVRSIYWP
ncbi:Glycosyltransferase involved in cell wall bisynthesis [Nocardioides alpinus]|uniref:Glycosyltransferase involved in cell wall bisynthesis n=1 Tax=Nocardioides alpinus TaxID=748909 RepID=A0A1I0W3H5_9ACTN|nr:glycosyltransferase [Nocardioides alpinus]PKH37661.1 hypothetical protein CXG46_19745 [Nocardioides alpinus]SFA83182.1 Glycosyltransferase involved in cell wall bisynthesis [Nocardioides alpinus]